MLIYDGKLLNIYVEDFLKNKKMDNMVSMNVQQLKTKKEIVYNYADLFNKSKLEIKSNSYNKCKINKYEKNNKISKAKKVYNLNLIINNLKCSNKNKYFNKDDNFKQIKRFNTETNLFSNKNNDNSNEKIEYSLMGKQKSKSKDKDHFIKIEEYKNNIKELKINDKTESQLNSASNIYKPIILKDNYIKNDKSYTDKKISKPFYSKLILFKTKKNQNSMNKGNNKNNAMLNYFKNKSDFYYL